jgi:hypothetical protein
MDDSGFGYTANEQPLANALSLQLSEFFCPPHPFLEAP